MLIILFVFAVEQLSGIVNADFFFNDWSELEVIEEFGSLENQVEIFDVCKGDGGYYLVGGAVRYGDYGGMDAIVFYFNHGMEWYQVFGGFRDEAFLGCYYDGELYVSGYTYSPDFYGESTNFKTGFYMILDEGGTYKSHHILPYHLDIMPTVIWKDNSITLAGYLDNFGNTDIFTYDGSIKIYNYSGQDRVFRKEADYFYGSTTSKELGAVNRNLLVWSPNNYYVTKSDMDQSYWYFGVKEDEEEIGGVQFDDTIVLTKENYKYRLIEQVPALDCDRRSRVVFNNSEFEYCKAVYMGNTYLFNLEKIFEYQHNINREVYINSVTLIFSGSGLINGNPIESGTVLGVGKYRFIHGSDEIAFEVVENNTNLIVINLLDEKKEYVRQNSFNRKLLYLPLVVIGNILYKKYQ